MPRLESVAKAGYFPTPWSVVRQVRGVIRAGFARRGTRDENIYRILDPCCGTGTIIGYLAEDLAHSGRPDFQTFGIEVSKDRATEARDYVDHVLNADLFHCSVAHNSMSLLWLNPPYDDEAFSTEGIKRTELAFLQRTTSYLIPDAGILVYIIPRRILNGKVAEYLAAQYRTLKCWDFPPDEREIFGQIVIMAVRRSDPVPPPPNIVRDIRRWIDHPPDYGQVSRQYNSHYDIHFGKTGPILFNNLFLDPVEIAGEAAVKGLWQHPTFRMGLWPETDDLKRPLMPLRQGHIAMLTAAGFLDNMLLEKNGQRILVKGRTYKEFEVVEESEEKIVRQERMRTTVVSLDLDTGLFTDIRA